MGLASSRTEARHLVRHNHIKVNDRWLNIPSYQVPVGARISINEKAAEHLRVNASLEAASQRGTAEWLDVDLTTKQATFRELPARDQLDPGIREQLIVELYSK
jgi:small subunit ribosomal protein S4